MPGRAAHWIPRIIFSLLVGAVPALIVLGAGPGDTASYQLEIAIASNRAGILQVFYDRGNGIVRSDMTAVPMLDSDEPLVYRLPLPLATYRLFRIDPNNRPGAFTIVSVRILRPDGEVFTTLPLERLQAAHQAAIESRDAGSVTVVTPPRADDPQLLLEPSEPVQLTPMPATSDRARIVFLVSASVAFFFLLGLERLLRGANTGAPGVWLHARPRTTVVAAAIAGTLFALYPLLLGRSLVSPNNGGTALLYDQAPYVSGSRDVTIEDPRGTDVGAMMWAILPYTAVQREALRQREWPLWNRYNKGGEPLWGQGQTFALDPLHVASLFVPDVALAMDLRFAASRAVFAAGAGLVTLSMTGSIGAAVLIAVATPFIGAYTMRLNHPAYFSLTYAPWVLLGYLAMARAGTRAANARAGVGIAIASWLQLVGSTPKEGFVALAAVHAAGFLGVLFVQRPWRERLAALDMLAITGVAVVLASAPHWLVFLDTLSRSFTNYDRPAVLFAGWPDFVAFVLGAAYPGPPRPGVHALIAGLAIVGILQVRAPWRHPAAVACLVAALLFGAIAFGVVPAEFLVKLPLVANIHHVGFAFAAAIIPLVLAVAGVGAAALLDASTQRRVPIVIGAVVAALAVWLAGEIATTTANSPAQLLAFLSLAGATAVILLAPLATSAPRVPWGLAMTVGVATAVVAGGLAWETGNTTADGVLMQPRLRADLQRVSPALQPIVEAAKTADPFRVAPVGTVMFPGTQAYWGFEGIGGPDAVRLPLLEDLSDLSGVERTNWVWLTLLHGGNIPAARGYLDMLNVRYLVARDNEVPRAGTVLPVNGTDLVRVVERSTYWPRAFFVDGVERHESVLTFAARLSDAEGPFASILAAEADASAAVASLPSTATTTVPARDYRLTVNRTTFDVDTPGPGVAVLTEAIVDRDFVATLNGRPAPYFRVNHAFKGVAIPAAGTWEVGFEYRPDLWGLSWLMAGAGWIVIAGMGVIGWRPTSRLSGQASA